MKLTAIMLGLLLVSGLGLDKKCVAMTDRPSQKTLALPDPARDGSVSVEAALQARRSTRSDADTALTLAEIGQLLWAAQGLTGSRGFRTAPSAGALYPLEIFIVVGSVTDLPSGVYRYQPDNHALSKTADGDLRQALRQAALGQRCLAEAPVVMVISAVYERTTAKYRERGVRYARMEAGHAAQNVYLQAVPLDIGTVVIGAFQDQKVQSVLDCRTDENPLYLMPLGKRLR